VAQFKVVLSDTTVLGGQYFKTLPGALSICIALKPLIRIFMKAMYYLQHFG
jgi:hypothetical protein